MDNLAQGLAAFLLCNDLVTLRVEGSTDLVAAIQPVTGRLAVGAERTGRRSKSGGRTSSGRRRKMTIDDLLFELQSADDTRRERRVGVRLLMDESVGNVFKSKAEQIEKNADRKGIRRQRPHGHDTFASANDLTCLGGKGQGHGEANVQKLEQEE